ncbi:urease accessory protein [Ochrobactrum sp. POC9]|uniref:urease accessory protein UreD n=1 Tax=unclassified Ochrobactrum TaxID=239106 RepID=UPI000D707E9B|nr:urease accessory protein UreD [Ochrobactrum sp. POC9]MCH4540097.1 urease accessory protein UreD [Ochrobactrum sp. A-1]PWU76962.1 urease accessory protein [Ochrobactrum sp. POC9]
MIINNNKLAELSSQRVNGLGGLSIHFKDGRSRISRLYQEGAAKIRMPQVGGDPLEAILINTSGGLTGGDRLRWDVELGENASAVITTQACERIYRSGGGEARIATRLKAAKGTRLAWLPQETILFNQSVLSRTLDVELEEGAEILVVETTIFGRLAMGERVDEAMFSDRWRVRLGGQLVHAEEFRLGPDVGAELQARPVADGAFAVATVLLISGEAGRHLEAARQIIGGEGGASLWQVGAATKLMARLYAPDSYALRKRLGPLLALLNGKAGLPKVWTF